MWSRLSFSMFVAAAVLFAFLFNDGAYRHKKDEKKSKKHKKKHKKEKKRRRSDSSDSD